MNWSETIRRWRQLPAAAKLHRRWLAIPRDLCGLQQGLRGGTGGVAPPARKTRPDHATRFIETARGVLACSELAPCWPRATGVWKPPVTSRKLIHGRITNGSPPSFLVAAITISCPIGPTAGPVDFLDRLGQA